MTALEIILFICGIICVVLSFVISDKKSADISETEVPAELTEKQKTEIREQIERLVSDELGAVSERTEAQLDKISNTKILEMNEYSETILREINRNHSETVFLYDMLNEKAKEVKSTVKDVNITRKQVEKIQAEVTDTTVKDIPVKTENSEAEALSKDTAKNRLSNIVRKNQEELHSLHNVERTVSVQKEDKVLNVEKASKTDVSESKKDTEKVPAAKSGRTRKSEKTDSETKNTAAQKRAVKKLSDETAVTAEFGQNQVHEELTDINIQFERGTNKNDKVLKLYREGKNNKEIAKELNLGVGEVKLVIDLYNSGK